ncbi:restriction endonuclease subunit S [Nocardioides rotundus]|uniref:restriction endonuclease subunit S n=1 Tax=Nocardioides rotundus TaxID=1774216 RepID=UPI001CBC0A69|nr:restriction endonuclease subunit S [Nocardioides rotundus]UAL30159.1 restriction endonuclease subunit S [Nocardioides rotundus]
MSRIDELVEQLCPGGVSHRPLGEMGTFTRGNGLQKKDLLGSGVGAIHYGQVFTHYGTSATDTKSFVSAEMASKLRHARSGDLVIATTSENDEDVCKAVAWLGDSDIAVSGDACIYSHSLEPMYAAYYFQSSHFQTQKRRYITGTKLKRVSGADLARIVVPVPPMEVQREIVAVLDTMERLEAELEAELEARRLQYAHYRETLLQFGDDESVVWRPLGQVGSFQRGMRFTKADVVADGLPSIHYGEIYTVYGVSTDHARSHVRHDLQPQLRFADPATVVFAGVGETVEDVGNAVAWLGNEPVAIHDDTFGFTSPLDPTFVAYFARTAAFHAQKNRHVVRGKLKRLSSDSLARINIPVPSLKEQRRVTRILDSFDSLVNDLSSGLPAEIAARRKQYEYYRDRLLTFKELPA